MRKTKKYSSSVSGSITVSTETLAEMLDCGKVTAIKIGNAANARIQIGRRILWNTAKIRDYLDTPNMTIID